MYAKLFWKYGNIGVTNPDFFEASSELRYATATVTAVIRIEVMLLKKTAKNWQSVANKENPKTVSVILKIYFHCSRRVFAAPHENVSLLANK